MWIILCMILGLALTIVSICLFISNSELNGTKRNLELANRVANSWETQYYDLLKIALGYKQVIEDQKQLYASLDKLYKQLKLGKLEPTYDWKEGDKL